MIIFFSQSGAPVVYLVLFVVIMCRDDTYRLHMSVLPCILDDVTGPLIISQSILSLGIISKLEDISKFTTKMLNLSFIFPFIFALTISI